MITAEEARKRSEQGKQTYHQIEKERIFTELHQTEKHICKACEAGKTGIVLYLPRTTLPLSECQTIITEFFTKYHFKVRFPQSFRYIVEW